MNNRDVAASSTKSPTCSSFRTRTRFACAPIATRRGESPICPSRWPTSPPIRTATSPTSTASARIWPRKSKSCSKPARSRCSKSCGRKFPAACWRWSASRAWARKRRPPCSRSSASRSLDALRAACEADQVSGAQRLRQEDAGEDSGRHRPGRQRPRAHVLGPRRRNRSATARPHAADERHSADRSGRQLPPRPRNDRRHRPAGRRR